MADCHSIPTHRDCTKCGEYKDLDSFGNATRGRYGKKSVCKVCERAYIVANKDRINALSLAKYHKAQAPKRATKKAAREARIVSTEKACARCKRVKRKTEFKRHKDSVDGTHCYCKDCCNTINREHRKSNPEMAEAWSRRWREKNPEKRKAIYRRWASKPSNRIHLAVTARMYECLKSAKDWRRSEELIGYSFDELRRHLERQFIAGMTWDNYGEWHVDHIVPLSSFYITSPDDPAMKQAWAMTNLRPLWATENLKKGAKRLYLV